MKPSRRFPYKCSPKELKQSYELRLAAQFGDNKAKGRLEAYNRRKKERIMEAGKSEWSVDGRLLNRYGMMEYIVSRVANGESLPVVCGNPKMPTMELVYEWFENHPDFEKAYRRAEEIRGHRLGEQALETAVNTDRENVAADKLKFEALSKAAARTNRMFQDKTTVQNVDEYSSMTVDQIRERISRMVESNPELVSILKPANSLASLSYAPQIETLCTDSLPNPESDHTQPDPESE